MGEADGEPTTAPEPPRTPTAGGLLPPNRRARQELVRKNRRRIEEAREALQRPGSNVPPVTPAEIDANSDRIRARITATLQRAQIIYPDPRPMVRDIIDAWRAYAQKDANVVEVAVVQILAMVSDAERVGIKDTAQQDVEHTTLQELEALAPVHILCNAVQDALARKPGTLHALLPAYDEASPPVADTGAHIRAVASVGLAVMTLGKAQRGGISQTKAKQEVKDAFWKEGIDFKADTALEWAKRINRGDDPEARALFDDMILPVRKKAATNWPIKQRRALLKRFAEEAGRKLET